MTSPIEGPCEAWVTTQDLELTPGFDPDNQIEPLILSEAVDTASLLLYELSGRQYSGLCEITVRPTHTATCMDFLGYFGWSSNYPLPLYPLLNTCNCHNLQEIDLGAYPLYSITYVKIDGVTLSSSAYRIDDFRHLVRIDGSTWPTSQDLSLASTAANTFEVKFKYGRTVSATAKRAAGRLAMELAKAYSGQKCKLPERMQTMSREGVTVQFVADNFEYFTSRKTGIYEIDIFLSAINPKGRVGSAVIMSPDIEPSTRRVGT